MWSLRLKKFLDNPLVLFSYIRTHLLYRFIADSQSKKYEDVNFLSGAETIQNIIKNNRSLIRVGDGTFGYLNGASIYFNNWQFVFNRAFRRKLWQTLTAGQSENILYCFPYRFAQKTKAEFRAEGITEEWSIWILAKVLMGKMIHPKYTYGDSFCFHPRYNLDIDWNGLRSFFNTKHIIIVTAHAEKFKDLSLGKSTSFIESPPSDAWKTYRQLENQTLQIIENNQWEKSEVLIMISAAEAAKVMIYNLTMQGYTVWDTGQFFDLAAKEITAISD